MISSIARNKVRKTALLTLTSTFYYSVLVWWRGWGEHVFVNCVKFIGYIDNPFPCTPQSQRVNRAGFTKRGQCFDQNRTISRRPAVRRCAHTHFARSHAQPAAVLFTRSGCVQSIHTSFILYPPYNRVIFICLIIYFI